MLIQIKTTLESLPCAYPGRLLLSQKSQGQEPVPNNCKISHFHVTKRTSGLKPLAAIRAWLDDRCHAGPSPMRPVERIRKVGISECPQRATIRANHTYLVRSSDTSGIGGQVVTRRDTSRPPITHAKGSFACAVGCFIQSDTMRVITDDSSSIKPIYGDKPERTQKTERLTAIWDHYVWLHEALNVSTPCSPRLEQALGVSTRSSIAVADCSDTPLTQCRREFKYCN